MICVNEALISLSNFQHQNLVFRQKGDRLNDGPHVGVNTCRLHARTDCSLTKLRNVLLEVADIVSWCFFCPLLWCRSKDSQIYRLRDFELCRHKRPSMERNSDQRVCSLCWNTGFQGPDSPNLLVQGVYKLSCHYCCVSAWRCIRMW
jgi:hypothetical protein